MDAERDRWGKYIWDRFRPEGAEGIDWDSPDDERHDAEGLRASWTFQAEKVRADLIGEGNVVVGRERFERLRVLAEAIAITTRLEFAGTHHSTKRHEYYAARETIIASVVALQDGDLDPLP